MSNRKKTCCVFKCINRNTPSNSKVKFFRVPEPRFRPDQRKKWVEAIQNQNGQWWMPNASSAICSEHFEKGRPSKVPQDTDYVPSVFINKRKVDSIKWRPVSLKQFALEYMKQKELLERPSRFNVSTKRRKKAYVRLAAALAVPVNAVRVWERRFRQYFEEKLAEPEHTAGREPAAVGAPHWKTTVENRLYANPIKYRLSAMSFEGAVSARGVVAALCAAAHARGTLCSTAMYQDVRRALRLSSAISDLHAVWVSAQRVSLAQVRLAARAGDAGPPAPPSAADVADLVLLHSDVDMHRLVTDESVTLYEESSALHTLWQLVQQHQLEEAAHAPTRERALRWTSAHRDYLASGRTASLVVLQRRWHELKLQARVNLAAHWRRAPALQCSLFADLAPAPDPAADPAPDTAAPPPPHEVYPRPAPLHISILKRYPHVATGPFKCWREQVQDGSVVIEPLEEKTDKTVKQSQDSELSSASAAPGAQLCPSMSTLEEPREKQNPDSDTLSQEPAIEGPKIEQSLNLLLKRSSIEDFAEQSTADDHFAEHPTDIKVLTELPVVNKLKDEPTADNDLVAVQPTDSELLTVGESKVKQYTVNELLVEGSAVDAPLAESAAGRASTAGSAADQIHRDENEVLPPERANGSETDTDTEDNLVIDECYDMTPCSLKREPDAHTETHSGDTVSPNAVLGNLAPTIEVLHMIDPSTVKTEILFESDEDDFQPCNELDRDEMELATKKEASFISNRIVFDDEEPGGSCDVTNLIDCQNEQNMDNETSNFDPKLLMDTSVPLFRIDKTRVWRNNVRKDNSIRVSRIHRRYYTPKPKNIICNKNQSTTQEITADTSFLDKIANTDSIRQLCRNIKREMIEEHPDVPTGNTPHKKAREESDSEDDQPLLEIRNKKSGDTTDDAEVDADVTELVEESSSDDELVNEKMQSALRGRGARWRAHGVRGRGCSRAASTIEWAAAYSPVFGRFTKRVSLPDIEQVRRLNRAMQVAQVAPITSATSTCGQEVPMEQPPADAADNHTNSTPLAWRALDLPAQHELQTALDELTRASSAEQALETRGAHCCAARRQREVTDTHRRFGLPDAKQHTHADGECTCCCAHLSDAAARRSLDAQLRALHDDIERMLWKDAEGRVHSKPKPSRSPSPAQASTSATAAIAATAAAAAHKQASTGSPSNTATEAKGSKAKPAAYTNRSKRGRSRGRAPPPPAPAAPPAPPVNDYEEWQRQKNLNAQYFHISSNCTSKKYKSTASKSTSTRAAPAQSEQSVQHGAAPCASLPSGVHGAQSGLMPYIRESRLVAPVPAPPAPPAPRPAPPGPRKLVRIAPRPDNMPRPADLAQHHTIKQKPATTKECTKDHALVPLSPLTPLSKSVSILEEYSRTLPGAAAGAAPLLQALSLRAPASAGRTRTTIVMSLTLPAERDGNQTIDGLHTNDTVDLTQETDSSNSGSTQSELTTSSSVLDIVGVVKTLINSVGDRSLLKRLSNNASGRSLLRTSPSDEAARGPRLMSLSEGLHDGDVIEIDESDSNHSDGADDCYIPVNNSSNPAVYTNKSSNLTKSCKTKESCDLTTSNADESLDRTVSRTRPASEANGSARAADEPAATSSLPADKTIKRRIRIRDNKSRYLKPSNLLKSSEDEVSSHAAARACSRIPELAALTDGSGRCAARRAAPAAMPAFLQQLRRAQDSKPDGTYQHYVIPELAALTDGSGRCAARRAAPAAMPAFLQQLRRAQDSKPDGTYQHYVIPELAALTDGSGRCAARRAAPAAMPAFLQQLRRAQDSKPDGTYQHYVIPELAALTDGSGRCAARRAAPAAMPAFLQQLRRAQDSKPDGTYQHYVIPELAALTDGSGRCAARRAAPAAMPAFLQQLRRAQDSKPDGTYQHYVIPELAALTDGSGRCAARRAAPAAMPAFLQQLRRAQDSKPDGTYQHYVIPELAALTDGSGRCAARRAAPAAMPAFLQQLRRAQDSKPDGTYQHYVIPELAALTDGSGRCAARRAAPAAMPAFLQQLRRAQDSKPDGTYQHYVIPELAALTDGSGRCAARRAAPAAMPAFLQQLRRAQDSKPDGTYQHYVIPELAALTDGSGRCAARRAAPAAMPAFLQQLRRAQDSKPDGTYQHYVIPELAALTDGSGRCAARRAAPAAMPAFLQQLRRAQDSKPDGTYQHYVIPELAALTDGSGRCAARRAAPAAMPAFLQQLRRAQDSKPDGTYQHYVIPELAALTDGSGRCAARRAAPAAMPAFLQQLRRAQDSKPDGTYQHYVIPELAALTDGSGRCAARRAAPAAMPAFLQQLRRAQDSKPDGTYQHYVIPELAALTDGSGRCAARRAAPAAMPAFLQQLRRAQDSKPDGTYQHYVIPELAALTDGSGRCAARRAAPAAMPAFLQQLRRAQDSKPDGTYQHYVIPELAALTDGSGRCAARRAAPAAMPAFLQQLRRAQDSKPDEVYCYKRAAQEQAVGALPCGGTLLCVDGTRAPLVLPARAAPTCARAHLVLSDAELPCALPTYWTLASYAQVARVVPDEVRAPGAPGPRGARGAGVAPEEDARQICEKEHNFKILTAFCSADGVRQAARAGATLLLLNVLRARVCVLSVTRAGGPGAVRHCARAHVAPELLQELEAMLDDAEVDEELGGRADDTDQ